MTAGQSNLITSQLPNKKNVIKILNVTKKSRQQSNHVNFRIIISAFDVHTKQKEIIYLESL